MFDFIDALQFGKEVNAHGEKWESVKILPNRYHIAVRANSKLPLQCFIVREGEPEVQNTNLTEPNENVSAIHYPIRAVDAS